MDAAMRDRIVGLLDSHPVMTIATLRPDGWPQATVVGYVNQGLALYFLCGLDSQKAANIARDDRVSIAIASDPDDLHGQQSCGFEIAPESSNSSAPGTRVLGERRYFLHECLNAFPIFRLSALKF